MTLQDHTVPIAEPVDAGPDQVLALVLTLASELRPVLLDSCGHAPPEATFLIAAFDPFAVVDSEGGDPLAALARRLSELVRGPAPGGLPAGAAVGALAYDLGRRYERIPSTAGIDAPSPEASIALYDVLVVHDYGRRQSFVVSTGLPLRGSAGARRARERARDVMNLLARAPRVAEGACASGQPASNFTRASYADAVRRAQSYIDAGDVYQVNLTQRFTTALGGLAPETLFLRLRRRNPAAFSAFLREPGRAVVSTSPERFLCVDGRRAEMWPIKGTRPRVANAAEDDRLAVELMASEKDRAENLMIVDLVRNDLGRVAEHGSVVVEELFGLRSLPTVHHLVSRVSATLREGASACDLLRAAFPCGSITGAPKIRAMEIIEELEGVRRGLSMGAIGYASFDGRMDWNVAIRTMEIVDGVARFNVGGGVVADSDPANEYEESLWKARAILEALRGDGP